MRGFVTALLFASLLIMATVGATEAQMTPAPRRLDWKDLLPPAAQKEAVAEACRTAKRFFVASFFHPCSAHHATRRLRDLLSLRAPARHAITLGRLRRWCASNGFELYACRAEVAFVKDLWVASFVRKQRRDQVHY